jgi:hypothetical protein
MGQEVLEWTDVALGRRHVAGCHEHNSRHLRSKNAGGFLGYLRTYCLPQKKNLDSFWKKLLEYKIS